VRRWRGERLFEDNAITLADAGHAHVPQEGRAAWTVERGRQGVDGCAVGHALLAVSLIMGQSHPRSCLLPRRAPYSLSLIPYVPYPRLKSCKLHFKRAVVVRQVFPRLDSPGRHGHDCFVACDFPTGGIGVVSMLEKPRLSRAPMIAVAGAAQGGMRGQPRLAGSGALATNAAATLTSKPGVNAQIWGPDGIHGSAKSPILWMGFSPSVVLTNSIFAPLYDGSLFTHTVVGKTSQWG